VKFHNSASLCWFGPSQRVPPQPIREPRAVPLISQDRQHLYDGFGASRPAAFKTGGSFQPAGPGQEQPLADVGYYSLQQSYKVQAHSAAFQLGFVRVDMNPLAKKLLLILYFAIFGAIFADYLMGLGWFGRYDKIAMWAFVAFAMLVGRWLKSRAEKKAQNAEIVLEALDAKGAVRSDPRTRRFIWKTVSIVGGIATFVIFALAYRDRNHGDPFVYALVATVVVVTVSVVCWHRFGNISGVEGDDGVTLTLSRRGQTIRVPWALVNSVEVSRPYAFWQVQLKFRGVDESKAQTVRFLPLGWQRMTPAAAEKLQSALEQRRMVA
jgi:hypothetical protein